MWLEKSNGDCCKATRDKKILQETCAALAAALAANAAQTAGVMAHNIVQVHPTKHPASVHHRCRHGTESPQGSSCAKNERPASKQ